MLIPWCQRPCGVRHGNPQALLLTNHGSPYITNVAGNKFKSYISIGGSEYVLRGDYDPELPEGKDITKTGEFILLGEHFKGQLGLGMWADRNGKYSLIDSESDLYKSIQALLDAAQPTGAKDI